MKSILVSIWAFAAGLFKTKAVTETASPAPGTAVATTTTAPQDVFDTDAQLAIDLVNNVRKALASPVAVLISDMIPVAIVGDIREELVNELPKLASGIAFIKSTIDSADVSAVFNDILGQIKLSPNKDMDAFEHALAARALTIISQGKTGWSTAVVAVEYYLQNVVKKAVAAIEGKAVAAPVAEAVASPSEVIAAAAAAIPAAAEASPNPLQ